MENCIRGVRSEHTARRWLVSPAADMKIYTYIICFFGILVAFALSRAGHGKHGWR